jgi:anaerobic selenocysteine-containing dehydrogenase
VGASEEFPFHLLVWHHPSDWWSDSWFRQASTLRREIERFPTPFLLMNPAEARSRELKEGMPAMVKTPLGEGRFYVRCDPEVPLGMILVPRCFAAEAAGVLGQAAYEETTGAWLYPASIGRIEKAVA